VRRTALLLALPLAVAACGSERENRLRPAPPVTLTAAIHKDTVQLSPRAIGAGAIVVLVSNQSGTPQTVTVETDDLEAGNRARSRQIAPRGTGRVTIDVRPGVYSVHVGDEGIRAARLRVGPPRPSGQDRLLLP